MDDGNLSLKTDFSGKIKIPETQIESISTENEVAFRMEDNRTFKGRMNFNQDGNFTIGVQEEKFSLLKVRHLWPEDADDPLILLAQSKAESLQLKWKHSLGFDLTGSSGNSENFGLGIRLDSALGNKFRGYDFIMGSIKVEKKIKPIED